MPFPLEQECPASRTRNAKIPPHACNPHQGAHVPPARAACACSEKAELRTRKWTASKRTGKSPQTKSQNAKIPHTHAQPHQGAHVPPARAACACSHQAELRTEKWTASKRTGKSPQTKSQNAKIPTHARNPTRAHTCFARAACACSNQAELRTGKWTASRTQNENTPQAELGTKKNASTHANSIRAHTCPRHVLRALAPRKPNLERENPRKQNLRMQKSPPTRVTPPRRTRAPSTCCVRLLQPSRT